MIADHINQFERRGNMPHEWVEVSILHLNITDLCPFVT